MGTGFCWSSPLPVAGSCEELQLPYWVCWRLQNLPPPINDFIGLGWKRERVGLLFDDGKKEGERGKEDGT